MTLVTIGESSKVRKKWLIFFVVGSPGCIIAFYFRLRIDFIVKADSLNLKPVVGPGKKTYKTALFLLVVGLMTASSEKNEQVEIVVPSVSVYVVGSKEVGQYLEFVARTQAYQSADIRARVKGELIERLFQEASFVEKYKS